MMKALSADSLLASLPFVSRQGRRCLSSSHRAQRASESCISGAAKIAVTALVCTNLVQLLLLSTQSDWPCDYDAPEPVTQVVASSPVGRQLTEAMMNNLPEVVKKSINAPMPFRDRHFAVFIIFSWNFPLFWSSLQTYMAAGWGKRVIILDNSVQHEVLNNPLVRQMVGEVIPTRVQLTFSQCQNYIADITVERNYTYFFWGHADVALLATTPEKSFAKEVLECMDEMDAQKPAWGLTYFHYDWFSATRLAVARDVRYDTFITVYMSDCDYYPRVRQAGYETLDADSVCKARPNVHDMKGYMELPLDDYDATKEALANIKITSWDRNSWKWRAWSLGEQIGWEMWELTTRQYFRYKWGMQRNRLPHTCKIEVDGPDGKKRIRQEPFETLDEIYVPLTFVPGRNYTDPEAEQRRLHMF